MPPLPDLRRALVDARLSTQAALLQTIAAERDLGVLLITHDRVLADAWCDDVQQIDGNRSRVVAG